MSSVRPLNNCQSTPPIFKDCVKVKSSSWYGGSETFVQKWPLNRHDIPSSPYLTTDLPKHFGNVLERYFLSSEGVSIYFPDEIPLYVSLVDNDRICFESKYTEVRFGPSYKNETAGDLELSYRVCVGENPKMIHQFATSKISEGFIPRPQSLPDVKVFQYPIWSTWARCFQNIYFFYYYLVGFLILKFSFTQAVFQFVRAGVGKIRPAGQLRPTKQKCLACDVLLS